MNRLRELPVLLTNQLKGDSMSETMTINVNVEQLGESASRGRARKHQVLMDRPEAKGGEDKGPMGGENLLMSLGGCFMSNLLAAAKSRDIELSGAALDITGTIQGTPSRFAAIHMKVSIDTTDPAVRKKLVTIAERGCLVANTLKQALELTIDIKE
jgi:putative redox protein